MECPFSARGQYTDSLLQPILSSAKRIAIIGLSPDESKDSNKVARYLLSRGLEIIPIYPKGEEILGQKVYRSLSEVEGHIDIVDVFRKSDALAPIALEVKNRGGVGVLWGQLGVENREAEEILAGSGVQIVQNLCLKIEYQRLFDS